MINGIGKSGPGRIDAQRLGLGQASAAAAPGAVAATSTAARGCGAIAEQLGQGAPIDGGKVAQIRAAIAEGRYAVDPDMIADRMIAADLGI
jgi:negative regulator of flagellin synthesis FlgM